MNTKRKKQSPSSGKQKKKGASIVEVLVALTIFAIFISGACKVIVAQRKLSNLSQAHYSAINIAKNQIEQVRNLRRSDYNQILLLQESAVRVNGKGQSDDNGRFLRSTTITKDNRNDYLIEIEVRVDLLNPVTRTFSGEHEILRSYMAHLLNI